MYGLVGWVALRQDRESDSTSADSDIFSEIGDEFEVVVDRWSVGQLGLWDLVAAGAVIALGALLAWVARAVARRLSRRSSGLGVGAIQVVGQLCGVAIVLLSVALALEILGFTIGPIMVLLLVAVVGLLIMRPIITNLSTGLLLQMRSSFAVGDLVETNGMLGVVEEINARTVVLVSSDGRRVHVPNTQVLEEIIENYTAIGHRRSIVQVVLEDPADVARAIESLQLALVSVPTVLASPPAHVTVSRLHGRHPVLDVLFWHEPDLGSQRRARDEVARAMLADALSSGVELATPVPLADWYRPPGWDTEHE